MTQLDPKMRVGLRIKELRAGLGLSQEAIDGLHRLHAQAVTDPKAAELQRLLDKLICSYAHEADKLL